MRMPHLSVIPEGRCFVLSLPVMSDVFWLTRMLFGSSWHHVPFRHVHKGAVVAHAAVESVQTGEMSTLIRVARSGGARQSGHRRP
jgi:hypothetical protein